MNKLTIVVIAVAVFLPFGFASANIADSVSDSVVVSTFADPYAVVTPPSPAPSPVPPQSAPTAPQYDYATGNGCCYTPPVVYTVNGVVVDPATLPTVECPVAGRCMDTSGTDNFKAEMRELVRQLKASNSWQSFKAIFGAWENI